MAQAKGVVPRDGERTFGVCRELGEGLQPVGQCGGIVFGGDGGFTIRHLGAKRVDVAEEKWW
jgi:hypothetical protein